MEHFVTYLCLRPAHNAKTTKLRKQTEENIRRPQAAQPATKPRSETEFYYDAVRMLRFGQEKPHWQSLCACVIIFIIFSQFDVVHNCVAIILPENEKMEWTGGGSFFKRQQFSRYERDVFRYMV